MKAAKPSSDPESTDQQRLSVKQRAGDAANRWLARNRSLVLRQTPVWAQSLALILISVGSIGVIGGIFFRIDEVVSVRGQLKSIGGTIEVETPVGGRVAEVLFKDGEKIKKGEYLLDGSPAPHDILRILGVEKLTEYFVSEVQEVYRLQGVVINDKHIETIVRQMLKRVEIKDPGDSELLVGEVIDLLDINKINEKLREEKKKPAVFERVFRGFS